MPILPCSHPDELVRQIEPTKELLRKLDAEHPDLLEARGITPADYHGRLVFRSAVESIRGTFAATTSPRAGFTNGILEGLKKARAIGEWQSIGGRGRCDYNVLIASKPKGLKIAIESKGGEGNSFNIGDRPIWADEYVIWGHLDGAIVHQPSHGAESNLFTRLSAEIVANGKKVDAYIVLDRFCGTPIRPCPKMPDPASGRIPPPCVFLLPRGVPSAAEPTPRRAKPTDVRFVNKMLAYFGVKPKDRGLHIRTVGIEVFRRASKKKSYNAVPVRKVTVYQGRTVLESRELKITRGRDILRDVPLLREHS